MWRNRGDSIIAKGSELCTLGSLSESIALCQPNSRFLEGRSQMWNPLNRNVVKSQNTSLSKSPDLTEPVIGWRSWVLDKERGRLSSCCTSHEWPFRKPIQANDPNWHMDSSPAGIHAYKFRRSAPAYANGGLVVHQGASVADPAAVMDGQKVFYAIGSVSMWGRIIEHTDGYRSEFAYPKELFLPDCDPLLVLQLEDNYGAPVNFAKQTSWLSPQTPNPSYG